VKLLQRRLNIAVLFVTHDQIEALSLSSRVALMDFGVIQQMGHPRELYEEPANEFVRDFVGKTALFQGKIQTSNPSGQVAVAIEGAPDCVLFGRVYDIDRLDPYKPVFIGVRPEDVEVATAEGATPPSGMIGGLVVTSLFTGERMEYQVEVDGQRTIFVYGDRRNALDDGAAVWLRRHPDGHSVWPSDWSHLEAEATPSALP
jgi:ABC-type Fe3+/spermidine/putrescine transport system ATPase subunit